MLHWTEPTENQKEKLVKMLKLFSLEKFPEEMYLIWKHL